MGEGLLWTSFCVLSYIRLLCLLHSNVTYYITGETNLFLVILSPTAILFKAVATRGLHANKLQGVLLSFFLKSVSIFFSDDQYLTAIDL